MLASTHVSSGDQSMSFPRRHDGELPLVARPPRTPPAVPSPNRGSSHRAKAALSSSGSTMSDPDPLCRPEVQADTEPDILTRASHRPPAASVNGEVARWSTPRQTFLAERLSPNGFDKTDRRVLHRPPGDRSRQTEASRRQATTPTLLRPRTHPPASSRFATIDHSHQPRSSNRLCVHKRDQSAIG